MDRKTRLPLLLLLLPLLTSSQHHRSYDWRTTGGALGEWPKISSLQPYAAPTQSSEELHHPPPAYHQDSLPYADDSASYSSQEYHQGGYPEVSQSLSSYESYRDPRDEELNMTMARVGGFAGSGDTKGFGAYDFPKEARPQPHHQMALHPDPELEELMRISKQRAGGFRDPMPLLHPLPPPL